MAGFETSAELHKRLDDLEKEIGRVQSHAALPPAGHREGEALRAKGQALRSKLESAEAAGWEEAKHEIHAEWDALIHAMERWAKRVDRRFDER